MGPNAFPSTPTTRTAQTAARTSPIGHWQNSVRITRTIPSPSGTSSTITTDSYITLSIARNTRRTSNAICRIYPFAKDFWGFAKAGAQLADLHVNYESQPEYDKLKFVQTPDTPLDWRVEKMKLSKDKTQIVYNNFLTLDGIPTESV